MPTYISLDELMSSQMLGNPFLFRLPAEQQQLAARIAATQPTVKNKSPTPSATLLPVILHHSGYPQENTKVYNFQCNCACPDDGFSFSAPQAWSDYQTPLVQPTLHGQLLPADHLLLFNPYHDQGVTVLNPAAQHLWQQFHQPRLLHDVIEQHVPAGSHFCHCTHGRPGCVAAIRVSAAGA